MRDPLGWLSAARLYGERSGTGEDLVRLGRQIGVFRCPAPPSRRRGKSRLAYRNRNRFRFGNSAAGKSLVKPLDTLVISGREVLPLVEGGKGISVSNGESSGAWAAAGGVGTFSGVNADSYDASGRLIPPIYHGKTRRERHEELIAYSIAGGIHQARVAYETSGGNGRIHMNVLWEMG